MSIQTFTLEWAGRPLTIEVGRFAKQADASCTVRYGDTMVLATAVMSKEVRPGLGFFPLMVDFEEKFFAAGKIKGSRFIKREGRPPETAVLTGRMIDRTIRPLFDDRIRNDIQVIASVVSFDEENDPDVPAIVAAATVLHMSRIPWAGPVSGVRVGRVGGELVVNPTYAQRDESDLDLVVCGAPNSLLMVEAGADQVEDDEMSAAVEFGLNQLAEVNALIDEVRAKVGAEKVDPETFSESDEEREARERVEAIAKPKIRELMEVSFFGEPLARKIDRAVATSKLKKDLAAFLEEQGVAEEHMHYGTGIVKSTIEGIVSQEILDNDRRVDGRKIEEVREIGADVALLPRTHGSALFMRGETQMLSTVTLAGPGAQQIVDTMEMDMKKRYMHHYSFPPFSVGEARPMRGPGRREIGHGALAEKALEPVIPDVNEFPYTIRVTSDTMGSNGSSSMGSVCGSTLALMDAGVPLKAPVAGVAIGISSTPGMESYKVFTDLQDLEDGKGGMDFKVAGTENGVTAVQLDTKTLGLPMDVVREAFRQAREGRMHILGVMKEAIAAPRADLSEFAPRIETLQINPEKIRDVIGPGGKMINQIIEKTGVDIDIEDDGSIFITAKDPSGMKLAVKWIQDLTTEPEIGKQYTGKVTRLMDFGAFVEFLPGQEGLVHISEMAPYRVGKVADIVKVDQEVQIKVVEIDDLGRVNLSMKRAEGNTYPEPPKQAPQGDRPPRRNGPRPGGGDRPNRRPPRPSNRPQA